MSKEKDKDSFVGKLIETVKSKNRKFWIDAGFVLTAGNIVMLTLRYIYCISTVSRHIFTGNIMYLVVFGIGPIVLWFFSTFEDFYNFHYRKLFMLGMVVLNDLLILMQFPYEISWQVFVPMILKIHPNRAFTRSMVLNLARMAVTFPTLIAGGIAGYAVCQPLFSKEGRESIVAFKASHIIDTRKNKDSAYDFAVVYDLKTGEIRRLKEHDRFMHMLINGATGTGKTSSVFLNGINDDLDKKIENAMKRQEAYMQMVLDKKAKLTGPVKNNVFVDDYIVPNPGHEEEYEAIKKRWPDCGLTVMAPNSGLTDDVVKLCKAKGIPVNVIDPVPDERTGKPKDGLMGMNPFDIPDGLDEEEMIIQISQRAQNFADVMSQINAIKGDVDQYFDGVNASVTTNVAMVCMRAIPLLEGRQANILDIHACINDYSLLTPMVEAIENHYGISIKALKKSKKKDDNGPAIDDLPQEEKKLSEKEKREKERKERENGYYDALFYIKYELQGETAEKMFDQSRGLRNLINGFLQNPRIRRLLTTENRIDFDKILHNGEVTVCNTAAELGDSVSTAFGLFFILNMKQATYRRKSFDRMPHFWYIDEFALYLLPAVEQMFTLFRQYGVSMCVAIQTLDQMERTNMTKYLKGIITGSCATQIVFGRANISDMKLYSELAGKSDVTVIQESVSRNSILDSNPDMRTQQRISAEKRNVLEGTDIRNRDFQEITVFSVDNGRILDPFLGKVNFLDRKNFKSKRRKRYNWNKLLEKQQMVEQMDKEDMSTNKSGEDLVNVIANDTNTVESNETKYEPSDIVKPESLKEYMKKMEESASADKDGVKTGANRRIQVIPIRRSGRDNGRNDAYENKHETGEGSLSDDEAAELERLQASLDAAE